MPWPAIPSDLVTTHLDSATDSPGKARTAILRCVQAVRSIIGARNAASGICGLESNGKVADARIGRGSANGVAPLDASGIIPTGYLPIAATASVGAIRTATDAEAGAAVRTDKCLTPANVNTILGKAGKVRSVVIGQPVINGSGNVVTGVAMTQSLVGTTLTLTLVVTRGQISPAPSPSPSPPPSSPPPGQLP